MQFHLDTALAACGIAPETRRHYQTATAWRTAHPMRWFSSDEPWVQPLAEARIALVYGGATKIKGYVFEAPRLPEIRGASALLDRINQVDIPLLWQENGLPRAALVYASGGTFLAFAPAGERARVLADAVERIYTTETLTANSVAVSDEVALLDLLFGRCAATYGLAEFRRDMNRDHAAIRAALEQYYVLPTRRSAPGSDDLEWRFLNRKTFGELVTLLASRANQRREERGDTDARQRRHIPHYELLPWAQKCEMSDIRPAVIPTRLEDAPLMSEASARKAHVGRLVKGEPRQTWFREWSNWHYRGRESAVAGAEARADHALLSWEERWETWLQQEEHHATPYARAFRQYADVRAAHDITEIAAASTAPRTQGYIGFISADGDRVGQRLAHLETADAYARFASALSEAAEQAVFTALAHHLHPVMIDGTPVHPFEILTIGGDDLMVMVPADAALEIAQTIGITFERIMAGFAQEHPEPGGDYQARPRPHGRSSGAVPAFPDLPEAYVGISAGVLIAPASTPIFFLDRLANELQTSAKRYAREWQRVREGADETHPPDAGGAVDMMVLKSVTMVSDRIADFRQLAYGVGERPAAQQSDAQQLPVERIARPYLWRDLAGLLATVRQFKQAAFPRSQLYRLREVLFTESAPVYASTLEFLYTIARQSDAVQQAFRDFRTMWHPETPDVQHLVPWRQGARLNTNGEMEPYWETIWPDLVELYDFVPVLEETDA